MPYLKTWVYVFLSLSLGLVKQNCVLLGGKVAGFLCAQGQSEKNTLAENFGDGNKDVADNQSQPPIPFENTFSNVAYQVLWSSQPF